MILACSFISFSISFERFLASSEGSNIKAGKLSVKFRDRLKLMLSCEMKQNVELFCCYFNKIQICNIFLKACILSKFKYTLFIVHSVLFPCYVFIEK